MAGVKINNYNQSDSNILELQLTSDQSFKGKHLVSLTNYDNTSLPAVAAGSVIEVNGALYKFTSEEAITGSPSDGTVYIYIDPATITAVFTNTAPTWSDSKQGWYGTAGTVNCRYLEFVMYKSSSTYGSKQMLYVCERNNINENLRYNSSGQSMTTATDVLIFSTKVFDLSSNGAYNVSTGVFTCPKSGYYHIFVDVNNSGDVVTPIIVETVSTEFGTKASYLLNIPSTLYQFSEHGCFAYLPKNSTTKIYARSLSTSTILNTSTIIIKKIL